MPQTTETGDRYQGAGVSWGAILARTARVPRVFLDDHVERDLPCPPMRRETKQALLAAGVTGLANDWTREQPACVRGRD
jgi:hypothetical protein